MVRQTVHSVHKQGGDYIAFDSEDNMLGEAGALNIRGESVSMASDTMLYFGGQSVARVEPDMHADGVLFIE